MPHEDVEGEDDEVEFRVVRVDEPLEVDDEVGFFDREEVLLREEGLEVRGGREETAVRRAVRMSVA